MKVAGVVFVELKEYYGLGQKFFVVTRIHFCVKSALVLQRREQLKGNDK